MRLQEFRECAALSTHHKGTHPPALSRKALVGQWAAEGAQSAPRGGPVQCAELVAVGITHVGQVQRAQLTLAQAGRLLD